jgi:PAS domain S-box-containing protein
MISVLYVDDEEALLDIGRKYLERTGKLNVETTTSPPEALALLSSRSFDVVVSDYQMPEMDGIAFLRQLRITHPELPFIIFTGKGREEVAIEAFESGADFYLQKGGAPKPQFAELAKKIITAYEHRQGAFRIHKLNRLYSVLSATNKAIVRQNNVHDLLEEICRISVETGGFRMAWAGMAGEPDKATGPVACYGHSEGFFEAISGADKDTPGMWPTGTALRTGHYDICNSIPDDQRMQPWREAALQRGYKAVASFPFALGTKHAGALTLCAPDAGFFDEQIVSLLDEMSHDLTFALRVREDDEKRHRAEAELTRKNEDLAAAYEQLSAQEEELRQNYDELKRGEDALRESEEKYRRIVETANEGIWVLDEDFRTLFVNQKLSEFLGYPPREILGRNIAEFMDPEAAGDHAHRKKHRSEGKSERYERQFVRKDGGTCWLLVSGTPVFDHDGHFSGSFAMLTDISGLKTAEEKMARNEAKFRHMFDAAPYLIVSVNRQGTVVDCNRRILDVLSFDKSEVIGQPFSAFVHADHRPAAEEYFRQVLAAGTSRDQMYRMMRKDGREIDVSISSSALRDRSGVFFRAVCIIEDITRRRQMQESLLKKNEDLAESFEELTAIEEELRQHHDELAQSEEALRASEARYRTLFENAILGLFRSTPDGRILEVNPACAHMYGYASPDEMKSAVTSLKDLYVRPEDRDRFAEQMVSQGLVRALDIEFRRNDGHHIWLSMNAQGLRDDRGSVTTFEGTMEDITERRAAQLALQTANAKLQLLSSITRHDILNQLNALRGYLEMALDDETDAGKAAVLVKEQKIVDTIEEQILFTRDYQSMGMAAPAWQNVSEQLLWSTQGLCMRDVRIDSARSDLEVLADPLLVKVFYNLVDNSLRYGGDRMNLIRFSAHETEDGIACVYEDNGEGIPAKDKPRMFTRGFGRNTGLGMFLAKEILAITGLSIRESGESGKGARFEITVPKGAYRFRADPGECQEKTGS